MAEPSSSKNCNKPSSIKQEGTNPKYLLKASTTFSVARTPSDDDDDDGDVDGNNEGEEIAVKITPLTHFQPSTMSSVELGLGTLRVEYFENIELLQDGEEDNLPNGLVGVEKAAIEEIVNEDEDEMEEDDDEDDDDDEYFCGEEEKINGNNNTAPLSSSNPQQEDLSNIASSVSCEDDGEMRKYRKKSILRHARAEGKMTLGSSINTSFTSSTTSHNNNNSQFYNNFYARAAKRNDFQKYTRGPYAPLDRCNSTSASSANSSTIAQHYYPEGGWGYVILATAMFSHTLLCGFLLSGGFFATKVLDRFDHHDLRVECVWLVSLSLGLSLFLSPLWVSICKRRSTRLTAVFGGLVASLGCLFTSFASQFHQLFFSYLIFMGVGEGLTRDASSLMVGQYFKRKRDFVEIFLVSGSGLGILVMPTFLEYALGAIGWRLGLQAVTGTLFLIFFLGSCYRSASLYHPQRRAIIHLKNQKRKIKEKEKTSDRPPFFDISCLAVRQVQILLVSSAFTAWGLYSPLFHLALELQEGAMRDEASSSFEEEEDGRSFLSIYVYMGAGWILGALTFGFMCHQRNDECRISKLYLTQVGALLSGISIIALTNVKDASGLVTFAWVYGFGVGGYSYMLKVYTFEKVRARVFPRALSFIQCVQGAALTFGIPVTGYINSAAGWRKGYFLSAASIFIGFIIMFVNSVGSSPRLSRHKSSRSSMKTETTDSIQSPGLRRISFTFPDEEMSPPRMSKEERSSSGSERIRFSLHSHHSPIMNNTLMIRDPKELTRISEEGILDH